MRLENDYVVLDARVTGFSDSRDGAYRYYNFGSFAGGWSARLEVSQANGFKRGDMVELVYDLVGAAENVNYQRDGESRSMATQNLVPQLVEMRHPTKRAS